MVHLTETTNTLTKSEINMLWHTGCKNFFFEQQDRFEINHSENMVEDNGSLVWFDTAADCLMYCNFKRSEGYKTCVLWDLGLLKYALCVNEDIDHLTH